MSHGVLIGAGFIFFVLAGLFACQFIKTKDVVVKFFGTNKPFFMATVALCFTVAIVYSITNLVYDNKKEYYGVHELRGMVESYHFRTDKTSTITLSGAVFNGKKLSGRVTVFVYNFDGIDERGVETGRGIIANTQIRRADTNPMNINNRVTYTASIKIGDIVLGERITTPKHAVWRSSRATLARFLSPDNASTMQAMLFGDKSTLDDEINDEFRVSGLAHALAVSGLHVGLLVAMLMFLLKICRVRTRYQFPVVLVILALYCYLCDFKFSIIRASIMFLVILGNKIYLHKADLLSCISFAAILTLVLFPHAFWSWSFRLSYACMFGIALFFRPIKDFLDKIVHVRPRDQNTRTGSHPTPAWCAKFLDRITTGVTLYCCVTVATLPLCIQYFGYIATYGIVSNLFLLPILVLAFQVSVATAVTWVGGAVLFLINPLISFVIFASGAISNLWGAQIFLQNTGGLNIFWWLGLIFLSRFVFLRGRVKYTIAGVLLMVYTVGFFI